VTPVAQQQATSRTGADAQHGASARNGRIRPGLGLHRIDLAAVRSVIQAWLASRGLIALVALLLAVVGHRSLSGMLSNWDAALYAEIAESGYHAGSPQHLVAFFPGLPLLLRAGLSIGLPTQLSGVLIAAAGSAAAALALIRLGGRWTAIVWLFAPTAVFTTIGYTEAIFCGLAFWSWERARSRRWLAAGLLAAGACTMRVSGLFLIGALFIMIITTRTTTRRRRFARIGWLTIPAAVLAGYELYLHAIAGSWTAWFDAQAAGWYRGLTPPWRSFLHTLTAIMPGAYPAHPFWVWMFRAEMASMAIGVAVTVWCLARRMWAEAGWVAVQVVAFSLSYWFISVNRATLLWFPLWMMIAGWITMRPRHRPTRWLHQLIVVTACALGAVLMMFWAWLYFRGFWAS
jgi:hypothetical protein